MKNSFLRPKESKTRSFSSTWNKITKAIENRENKKKSMHILIVTISVHQHNHGNGFLSLLPLVSNVEIAFLYPITLTWPISKSKLARLFFINLYLPCKIIRKDTALRKFVLKAAFLIKNFFYRLIFEFVFCLLINMKAHSLKM